LRVNWKNLRKKIIVFCRSGNRSGQAKMIEQNGFKNHNGGTWQDVKQTINIKAVVLKICS
jgi:rhodanese-related sulfurtransferase